MAYYLADCPGGLRLFWPTKKVQKNYVHAKLMAYYMANCPGGLRFFWPNKKL